MSFPANTTFVPTPGRSPGPIRPDTARELLATLRELLEAERALRTLPQEPTKAWADAEARLRAAREAGAAAVGKAEWGL